MTYVYIVIGIIILIIFIDDVMPRRGSPSRPIKIKKRKVKVKRVER